MKLKICTSFIMLTIISITTCKSTETVNSQSASNNANQVITFQTSKNIVQVNKVLIDGGTTSLDTPFDLAQNLNEQIKEKFNLQLKDRGEAHITLTAPDETGLLFNGIDRKKVFTPDLIERISNLPLEASCVGQAFTPQRDHSVFFVVVTSPELTEIRAEILRRVEAIKGRSINGFKPEKQNFHITLGFTKKDIHGVAKDKSSCIENTKLELE